MRGQDQILIMYRQIAHRGVRQIQLQGFPVIAIVEGHPYRGFCAGEQQPTAVRIFAHRIDRCIVGQATGNELPALAAIAGAVDIGLEIVDAHAVHCGVGCERVDVRGFELRHLAPGRELRRRHVDPRSAGRAPLPDQAVIGTQPDEPILNRRGAGGIDDAALLLHPLQPQLADARRNTRIGTRQIGTHRLPGLSGVRGLVEPVGRVVHAVRILRCEEQRLGAIDADVRAGERNRRDVLYLAGTQIGPGDFIAPGAKDHVGIERIGHRIAVFDDTDRMPVAESDFAIIAAAGDAHRPAFLLPGADAIGKAIADSKPIQLRGRLVEP